MIDGWMTELGSVRDYAARLVALAPRQTNIFPQDKIPLGIILLGIIRWA